MDKPVLVKRPVAYRIPRVDGDRLSTTEWRYFNSEYLAQEEAEALGVDYQALYVRDGEAITMSRAEALEDAIERMGWPEIHAFQKYLALFLLLMLSGAGYAQFNGCRPGFCPGEFGRAFGPTSGGGVAPPACSYRLDFSEACNSMYLF